MEHNYELRPQRVTPAREHELSRTAFRCGGWSVRQPSEWRTWTLAEKASGVAGVALLAGVGLAAFLVPVALVAALLRGLGVLS